MPATAVTLRIENHAALPDGGPLEIRVTGRRGVFIGRDTHLDWTLPDTTRFISGKHCEVSYREGAYWLKDVSTNGTFVNGSDRRLKEAHRLRTGDRIDIGQYIIAVAVDGDDSAEMVRGPRDFGEPAPSAGGGAFAPDAWDVDLSAPPIPARDLKNQRKRPVVSGDALDWVVDAPPPMAPAFAPPPRLTPEPRMPAGGGTWDVDAPPAPRMDAPPSLPPVVPVLPPPPPAEVSVPAPRRPDNGGEGVFRRRPAGQALSPMEPPEFPIEPPPALPAAKPLEVAPVPQASLAAQPAGDLGIDWRRRFAESAGLPPETLRNRSEAELADQLGVVVRLMTEAMMALLADRAKAKAMMRTSDHTTMQALDNNPLRFSPTPEDAMRILFGPPTRSYLNCEAAFTQALNDVKSHQIGVYAAMQQALLALIEDLEPKQIEASLAPEKGVGALFASRKTQLWDTYVTRWTAKAGRHDRGMLDVFLRYMADAYDRPRAPPDKR